MMRRTLFLCSVMLISNCYAANTNQTVVVSFLNSLSQEQRAEAQKPFNDSSRREWHFFPASMWPRAGIGLSELTPAQQEMLFEVLKVHVSETGYTKVLQIIDLEHVLAEASGNLAMRDAKKYYAAFYGNPATDALWAWSFEGHHLSLNFTIADGKVSVAPRFLGANPATIQNGKRKGERTLHKEEDLGLELINSLSEEQKQMAVFQQKAFRDIVTSNATDVEPFKPVGIQYKDLTASQQLLLLSLINEYLATMPSELALERMNNLKNEALDKIRFGWAGGMIAGEGHYYRIQGKSFLVEFDNTQNQANHIHSVWRDFDGDFGRDLIREHYENATHD